MPTAGEQLGAALERLARLIPDQLKAAPDLTSRVDGVGFYVFDRKLDARNMNPEDRASLGKRVWVFTDENETNPAYSNAEVWFTRRFIIGIGTGSLDSADVHMFEGIITAALLQLHHGRTPGGVDLAIDIAPLTLESVLPSRLDHEREPILDPSEIQCLADWTIVAHAARDAIAPKA